MIQQKDGEEYVQEIQIPEEIFKYYQDKMTEVSIALSATNTKGKKIKDIKIRKESILVVFTKGGFEFTDLILFSNFSIVEVKEHITQRKVIHEEYDVKFEKLVPIAKYLWINDKHSEEKNLLGIKDMIKIAKMSRWNLSQNWAELFDIYILEAVEVNEIRNKISEKELSIKN